MNEKEKFSSWVVTFCGVGFIVCVTVAIFTDRLLSTRHVKQSIPVMNSIPSLIDIQRMIGVKPDGIYGKETKERWDEVINNQNATKVFKEAGEWQLEKTYN